MIKLHYETVNEQAYRYHDYSHGIWHSLRNKCFHIQYNIHIHSLTMDEDAIIHNRASPTPQ